MRLHLGIWPVFDRYRAALAIDPGECGGLRKYLEPGLVEEAELNGVRAIDGAPSFQRPRRPDSQNRVEAATKFEDLGLGR